MAWPTLTLPLSNSTNRLPTTGIASGTPVTILQAQYPTWSQGSEYPVVIIPLLKAHFMMLQRNLIYTAITRGKKKVIIVGDPAAYAMATNNADSNSRITLLKERLTL